MDDTPRAPGQQGSPVQEAAEHYASAWGFRMLPLWGPRNGGCSCRKGKACDRPGKHPRTRHGHVDATTDAKRIARWKWETANVGIAPGPESGLLVIDVDPQNGGREGLAELETRLGKLPAGPIVATGGGGWHLYFRHPEASVRSRTIAPGVEIQAAGKLVVAPPSIHVAGGIYRWQVSLQTALPDLPAAWLDFLCRGQCYIDHTRQPKTTQDHPGPLDRHRTPWRGSQSKFATDSSLDQFIESCIHKSMPQEPRRRHDCVFKLARLLQGHPKMARRPLNHFRPIVDRWYNRIVENLGSENVVASIDENWFDFAEGWGNVKYPGEEGLMTALLERAKAADPPTVAAQYGSEEIRLLVALCRELQREVGDGPFFLATTTVAKLFRLRDRKGNWNRMRAWRWLQGLVRDGVLDLVAPGDPEKRIAASFRYPHG